jgi:hypothetical protein
MVILGLVLGVVIAVVFAVQGCGHSSLRPHADVPAAEDGVRS